MNFEILLSTQNKRDLGFLQKMFKHNEPSHFNVLIINQTTAGNELESDDPGIRIINSYERGSPSSRNLAIQHMQGDICLMADDDIIYHKGFKSVILDAYTDLPDADLINFEAVDSDNKRYLKYPDPGPYKRNKFRVNTYVISFRREAIQKTETTFNKHFGVGSTFPGSTEFLFMSNAWNNGLKMYHVKEYIAQHPQESSGKRQGSDDAISARTALRYRLYGWLSVPWLARYIFNMTRRGYIRPSEFFHKFRTGMRAIRKYRSLVRNGDMS